MSDTERFIEYVEEIRENYELENHEKNIEKLSQLDEILCLILWKKHYDEERQLFTHLLSAVIGYKSQDTVRDKENRTKIFEYIYQLCLNMLNPQFQLDEFLKTLNLFTRYGKLEQHSTDILYTGDDDDQRDWLQKIRICFDIGIERISKENISTDPSTVFERLTSASLLFLKIEAVLCEDSIGKGKSLETMGGFPETIEFLRTSSQLSDGYKAAFDLLQMFIASLNRANEFHEAIKTVFHQLTHPQLPSSVWNDTIETFTQYIRITKNIIVVHLSEANIEIILALVDTLASRIQLSGYVKYCNDCKRDRDLNGGKHETYELVSFAMLLLKTCVKKSIIKPSLIDCIADFYQLKMGIISNFECQEHFKGSKASALAKIGKIVEMCDTDEKYQFFRNFLLTLLKHEFRTEQSENVFEYLLLLLKLSDQNEKWCDVLSFGFTAIRLCREELTLEQRINVGRKMHTALSNSRLCVTVDDFVHKNESRLPYFEIPWPDLLDEIGMLTFYGQLMTEASMDHEHSALNDRIIQQILNKRDLDLASYQFLFYIERFSYGTFGLEIETQLKQLMPNKSHYPDPESFWLALDIERGFDEIPQQFEGQKSSKPLFNQFKLKKFLAAAAQNSNRKLAHIALTHGFDDEASAISKHLYEISDILGNDFGRLESASNLMQSFEETDTDLSHGIVERGCDFIKSPELNVSELSMAKQIIVSTFIVNSILYYHYQGDEENETMVRLWSLQIFEKLDENLGRFLTLQCHVLLILKKERENQQECFEYVLSELKGFQDPTRTEPRQMQSLMTIFKVVTSINAYDVRLTTALGRNIAEAVAECEKICETFNYQLRVAKFKLISCTIKLINKDPQGFEVSMKQLLKHLEVYHYIDERRNSLHQIMKKIFRSNAECRDKCLMCTNHSYQLLIFRVFVLYSEFAFLTNEHDKHSATQESINKIFGDIENRNLTKAERELVRFAKGRMRKINEYIESLEETTNDTTDLEEGHTIMDGFEEFRGDVASIAVDFKTIIGLGSAD